MFNVYSNNLINVLVKPNAAVKPVATLKCKKLKRRLLCSNMSTFADLVE
jgi:hypothetical protein